MDMRMNTTTRVELELKPGVLEDPARVPVRSNEPRQRRLFVSLGDYVGGVGRWPRRAGERSGRRHQYESS